MRNCIHNLVAAGALFLLATPAAQAAAVAQAVPAQREPTPPPQVFRCTNASMAPAGVLTLSADGSYSFKAVSDADFTVIPNDPANGDGKVSLSGDALEPVSGPLKEHFEVTGTVSSSMGIASISFNDETGTLALLCSP